MRKGVAWPPRYLAATRCRAQKCVRTRPDSHRLKLTASRSSAQDNHVCWEKRHAPFSTRRTRAWPETKCRNTGVPALRAAYFISTEARKPTSRSPDSSFGWNRTLPFCTPLSCPAESCATACATDVNILDRSSERTARDLATLSTTFSYAFRLRTTRKGAGPAAALTILAPNVSSDVRPHVTPRSRT